MKLVPGARVVDADADGHAAPRPVRLVPDHLHHRSRHRRQDGRGLRLCHGRSRLGGPRGRLGRQRAILADGVDAHLRGASFNRALARYISHALPRCMKHALAALWPLALAASFALVVRPAGRPAPSNTPRAQIRPSSAQPLLGRIMEVLASMADGRVRAGVPRSPRPVGRTALASTHGRVHGLRLLGRCSATHLGGAAGASGVRYLLSFSARERFRTAMSRTPHPPEAAARGRGAHLAPCPAVASPVRSCRPPRAKQSGSHARAARGKPAPADAVPSQM